MLPQSDESMDADMNSRNSLHDSLSNSNSNSNIPSGMMTDSEADIDEENSTAKGGYSRCDIAKMCVIFLFIIGLIFSGALARNELKQAALDMFFFFSTRKTEGT